MFDADRLHVILILGLLLVISTALPAQQIKNLTIHSATGEGCSHPPENLVDGDASDEASWRATGDPLFPRNIVVDLGELHMVNAVEVIPYAGRGYAYEIATTTDPNRGFVKVATRAASDTATLHAFANQPARYLRLRVTGADEYTGHWVSINELRAFTEAPTAVRSPGQPKIEIYPNPATDTIIIEMPTPGIEMRLVAADGKPVRTWTTVANRTVVDVGDLPPGVYTVLGRNFKQSIVIQ